MESGPAMAATRQTQRILRPQGMPADEEGR